MLKVTELFPLGVGLVIMNNYILLYSHRQKKLDTSLNRRKIKSNKDRINLKTGNKAGIH